jgi:hypothetical protein
MRHPSRNLRIAFNHRGLKHHGGVFYFHEFVRVLQCRPGELTRPQNRTILRLTEMPENKTVMEKLLQQIHRQKSLAE